MKMIVFDLDGTLIAGNSFTLFVKWLWRKRGFPLLLPGVVLMRKMRLVSHAGAKHMIMNYANRHLTAEDYKDFATRLRGILRPSVAASLRSGKDEGKMIVMATAAPVEYALPLGEDIGTDCVLATHSGTSGEDTECRGEVKRSEVESLCRQVNGRVECFYTDHQDDLPLIEWTLTQGGSVVLVEPDITTRDTIRERGLSVNIL